MWKAALAGAWALAAAGVFSAPAQAFEAAGGQHETASYVEGQIAQAKAALRLTPAQERHWPRVAAALRALARASAASDDNEGFVRRVRNRAASLSAQAAGARRVLAAAGPLIRSLDAEQKQTAKMLISAAGFGHLASRF